MSSSCPCEPKPGDPLARLILCDAHKAMADLLVKEERERCAKIVEDKRDADLAVAESVKEHGLGSQDAFLYSARVLGLALDLIRES